MKSRIVIAQRINTMPSFDHDVEKSGEAKSPPINVTEKLTDSDNSPDNTKASSLENSSQHDIAPTPVLLRGKLARWNEKVEGLSGLEARGITRVLPEDKHQGGLRSYTQMFLLWFSINLVANNIITGLLGPLIFGLGWVDSVCIVIFASALATAGPAYIATFGPESGNRTMVS